jgi:hypothetical protein
MHPTTENHHEKDRAAWNLSDRIPDGDNDTTKHSSDEPKIVKGATKMCHTNRPGGWVPLAVLLSVLTPALAGVAGERTATPARNATVLGEPDDAELFAAYQCDHSNQKVQSWGHFRGWVQTFYRGNLMSEGWSKFGEVTANAVKSAAARQAVIAEINELGRMIGLEWAKDSSVRKISTADLRRWNDVLAVARQRDDGGGQRISDALRAVRRMAERLR